MIKNLIFIGLSLLSCFALDASVENEKFPPKFNEDCITEQVTHYKVEKDEHSWYTTFVLASDKRLFGTVKKTIFHVTDHYDFYDVHGEFKAQGRSRIFCLGRVAAWGTELDISDADGNKIGMIDGQWATSAPAKFSIYDAKGTRVGIAYLEQNCSAFTIIDPNNYEHLLVRLARNFILDKKDHWDIHVFENHAIPNEILQIFVSFACDTQDQFKVDN